MASHCLKDALDESTIDRTWTAARLAERMCDVLADERDVVDDVFADTVKQILAGGGNDFYQSAYIAEAVDGCDNNTPYSDIAAKAGHDPHSKQFGDVMKDVAGHDRASNPGGLLMAVAELANGLDGLMGEADVVAADECPDGWEIAGTQLETSGVDLIHESGDTAQVMTSDAISQSKYDADEKIDDEDVADLDYYVVLHGFEDSMEFGVGVNDLNDEEYPGTDTAWSKTATCKAFNQTDR